MGGPSHLRYKNSINEHLGHLSSSIFRVSGSPLLYPSYGKKPIVGRLLRIKTLKEWEPRMKTLSSYGRSILSSLGALILLI